MAPHANPGVSNPNSFFDSKTVREIRLQHLCDGISASQIARDLEVNLSSISRIVNWKAWAHQDEDLRVIPKPGHKGGPVYHGIIKKPVKPLYTCRQCLHLTKDGCCGLEFPECISSAYKEAKNCNAFILKPSL